MNNILLNFLFFDYVILILSLLIVIFSFWKGFINSILGLLTWVGSVFVTIYTYKYLSDYLYKIFLYIDFLSKFEQFVSILSLIISIPLLFLISLFILKRIRRIISNDLDKQILGLILDKFFGVVYGIIFCYVILSTIIYFTSNTDINALTNFHDFLYENSLIFKNIGLYNNNIIDIYNYKTQEN